MVMPVNHPPAPVIESVNPAIPLDEDCEAITVRFEIETAPHDENRTGETKKSSREYQSHHILQDAAGVIARGEAIAVMLFNSHSGTEHGEITKCQNERRDNKKHHRGGEQPARTFGELKEKSRRDLVNSLEGRRADRESGKPMTKAEAEKVAECLVLEAEEATAEALEEKGIQLNDQLPVAQTGGCFAAQTPLWLTASDRRALIDLKPGDRVDLAAGFHPIVRIDTCRNELIRLCFDDWQVDIAPFDRVYLADDRLVRVDRLHPGDRVKTDRGSTPIRAIVPHPEQEPVYGFGFGRKTACRIGSGGLWVEIPDTGVAVVRDEPILPFRPAAKPGPAIGSVIPPPPGDGGIDLSGPCPLPRRGRAEDT